MGVNACWAAARARARVACAILFVAASACVASAQVTQVSGKVVLKQADGSVVPVAGAQVDIYRTDIQQKFGARTDKQGRYIYVVPFVGTYTIAVSAPGASPTYREGLRLGQQPDQDFTLSPGDGSRLTPEQIRAGAAVAPPAESEADRRRRAELGRANAEVEERNKKILAANEIVQRTFGEGNAALAAAGGLTGEAKLRKYDEAVALYDEGLSADPLQPALLTNRSIAIRARGVERYSAVTAIKDDAAKTAWLEAARKDFRDAADSARKAVEMIKASPAPADEAGRARFEANRLAALSAYAESMRLFIAKVDSSQLDAVVAAYREYVALEPDPAKRSKARSDAAKLLFDLGDLRAVDEYRRIIADEPRNLDAHFYLGMALAASSDKATLKEAATYLQLFLSAAPPTHPRRGDAEAMLGYLKSQ